MKSKKAKATNQRPAPLQWLGEMPPEFANDGRGEYSASVTLTLDTCAWLVYSRAAKKRGCTIEEVFNHVLRSEDIDFEDRGYLTSPEASDERAKRREAEAAK